MTAETIRRTALHDRAADLARGSRPGVAELRERPVARMLNLRGPQPDAPTGGHVLWLGPDEFLIVELDRVTDAVFPWATSLVDVSANRTLLVLSGSHSQDVLAKGIQIDLRTTGNGWCAQTLLASVPIILWRRDDDWLLLVRPSFANYIADWLLDAMQEFTAQP